ncbi:MAG TPA: lipopolysaccharide transport periplasmic protein LptA [Desulfobacterales bacterium]
MTSRWIDRKQKIRYGPRIALVVFVGLIAAASAAAAAQPDASREAAAGSRQIRITADQLTTHSEENFAEFSGNVEAVQGDFTIRSESLRIYFRREGQASESEAVGQDSIHQIVAEGNVRINTGQQTAKSDRAEYSVKEGTLVLIGEGSTVTDGLNSIEGSRLTLNRNTGKITVEGGEQRVRAVFYPNSDMGFSGLGAPSEEQRESSKP